MATTRSQLLCLVYLGVPKKNVNQNMIQIVPSILVNIKPICLSFLFIQVNNDGINNKCVGNVKLRLVPRAEMRYKKLNFKLTRHSQLA